MQISIVFGFEKDRRTGNVMGCTVLISSQMEAYQLFKRDSFLYSERNLSHGALGWSLNNLMSNSSNSNSILTAKTILCCYFLSSDKEHISRIFEEGFLDITDIESLPNQLVELVRRYIRL